MSDCCHHLDWSGPEHWSPRRAPCIYRGAPTNLRDDARRPAFKVCVERRIAQLRDAKRRRTLRVVA